MINGAALLAPSEVTLSTPGNATAIVTVEPSGDSSSNTVVPTKSTPSKNVIVTDTPALAGVASGVSVKRAAAAFPDSMLCVGQGCRRGIQSRVVPVSTADMGSFDANHS